MEKLEEKLFCGIRAGDTQAYSVLMRLYSHSLILFANSILSDIETAKDIVQELFIKLWTNKDSLEIKISVKLYLYRSVHNSCIDYLRKNIIKEKNTSSYDDLKTRLEVFEIGEADTGFETILTNEAEEALRKAIDNLPEQCKNIFILSRYEQLTYPEIAKMLDISLSTVKTQMVRAMRRIKESLDSYL